ncbi:MAG: hypothetical protein ABSF48_29250, partial [Thermodesulfobacteriota bacterium]
RHHPGPSTACLNCNVFVVVTCAMSKIFKARTEGALSSFRRLPRTRSGVRRNDGKGTKRTFYETIFVYCPLLSVVGAGGRPVAPTRQRRGLLSGIPLKQS